MTKYGFSFCPAWEYEIIEKEGIIGEGGSVIFTNKKDAEELGRRIGLINMPDEVVSLSIGGSMRDIPVIEQYEYFYIMSIDIDYANATMNKELEFVDAFKDNKIDFPPVWFTRERIPPECIIHSEKILI
jgi:hypothetical protein